MKNKRKNATIHLYYISFPYYKRWLRRPWKIPFNNKLSIVMVPTQNGPLERQNVGERDRSVHAEHWSQAICSEDGEDVTSRDFRYASVSPWEDGDGHSR